MGEMSKSREEIKKGLELCVNANSYNYPCDECPYVEQEDGCKSMMEDAMTYIQQLEQIALHWQSSMDQVQKTLQDNGFRTLEELLQSFSQVKRERDAAVADARGRCFSCRHGGVDERDEPCRTCLFETEGCISDKPAWEWRGAQEQPEGDEHGT